MHRKDEKNIGHFIGVEPSEEQPILFNKFSKGHKNILDITKDLK